MTNTNIGGRFQTKCFGTRLLSACFLFFSLAACSEKNRGGLPCDGHDAQCAMTQRLKHPARQIASWQKNLSMSIHERVGKGDAALVQFMALDNIASGFAERPQIAKQDDLLLQDIRDVLQALPDVVKRKVAPKLAGVMLVENFGGSGYSQYLYNKDDVPVAGFIVLDPQALRARTANSWATWKERSPFKADQSVMLNAVIEEPKNDTRQNAIRYILLHEIGHILSIGEAFHPIWTEPLVSASALAKFPFARASWLPMETAHVNRSRFDSAFPERKNVVYYFGARLDGTAAIPVYQKLSATNFPTLYAATNWGDDFAESLANYVHVVIDKRPFEIRITRDGITMMTYRACWEEERCRDKRRMVEAYLQ